jgi:hypothetical protein
MAPRTEVSSGQRHVTQRRFRQPNPNELTREGEENPEDFVSADANQRRVNCFVLKSLCSDSVNVLGGSGRESERRNDSADFAARGTETVGKSTNAGNTNNQ